MGIQEIKFKESRRFTLQRKVVAHKTASSWMSVPHVSYIYEPDISDFYEEFQNIYAQNEHMSGAKSNVSFNTLLLKVIAEGLLSAPDLNAHIDYDFKKGIGSLHICEEINISIPWILADRTMITPVVPGVDKLSLKQITDYIDHIAIRLSQTNIDEMLYQAVRTDTIGEIRKLNLSVLKRIMSASIGQHRLSRLKGKQKLSYYSIPESERLTEKDLLNGTITVSNVGSLYKEQRGHFGLLEIIPPQVCAIGIASIQEKAGFYIDDKGNQQLGLRKVLPMCIAFDHRAADFDALIPFLASLDDIFANPQVIHEW